MGRTYGRLGTEEHSFEEHAFHNDMAYGSFNSIDRVAEFGICGGVNVLTLLEPWLYCIARGAIIIGDLGLTDTNVQDGCFEKDRFVFEFCIT